ncbi:hypothetical protein ACJRO7_002965 [Eucalyptus globulus]|uniref:Bet v I/Major latex protein domain-containing protein n=1 Tax=Eucalyptus globulus TaxID=34317 RepID=A0ABD3LW95_EUCGL
MFGQLSHETEVKVGAGKAWELYGTLKLALLAKQELSHVIVDILEGDGGVGTLVKLTFERLSFTEKYTKVDHERRVKETEAIEGGLLDMGLTLFRVRLEVIGEDKEESCVLKSTIEYEVADGASSDVSIISIKPLADIAEIAKEHFTASVGAN